MVEIKFLLGNYVTDLIKTEISEYASPSGICIDLLESIPYVKVTTTNVKDVIKQIADVYNRDDNNDNNDNIENTIKNGMRNHNMDFVEYMEYLFAPTNYKLLTYDDNFKMSNGFDTTWTDSPVLLVGKSAYNSFTQSTSTPPTNGSLWINGNTVMYKNITMRIGKFIMRNLRNAGIDKGDVKMSNDVEYNGEHYSFEEFINKYIVPILK
jgi:hypothetical protein